MKKVLLEVASLLVIGSSAMAFEGTLKLQANGDLKLEPVKVVCELQSRASGDEPDWTVCRPADGKNCGEGYHRMNKYCWAGWKSGFKRCGYVCEKDRTNGFPPEMGND